MTETEAAQINTQRAPVETWKWKDSSDAQRAYLALAAVLAVGTDMSVQGFGNASLFYFVSLAVCTIYIGAHKGVTTPNQQQISFKQVCLLQSYLRSHDFPAGLSPAHAVHGSLQQIRYPRRQALAAGI